MNGYLLLLPPLPYVGNIILQQPWALQPRIIKCNTGETSLPSYPPNKNLQHLFYHTSHISRHLAHDHLFLIPSSQSSTPGATSVKSASPHKVLAVQGRKKTRNGHEGQKTTGVSCIHVILRSSPDKRLIMPDSQGQIRWHISCSAM